MKKVLREVCDKNGAIELVFTPTAAMIAFAAVRTHNPELSDAEVCKKAQISSQIVNLWKAKYGSYYSEWIEEMQENFVEDKAAILETVGMVHAVQGNFNYWKEMAKTHGVIKDEQAPKSITINTDFSAILLGGDFNKAREQLMHKIRGVLPAQGAPLPAPEEAIDVVPVPVPVPKKDLDLEF